MKIHYTTNFLIRLSLLLVLGLSIQKSFAVPAYPHPVEIQQPDGSKLTIVLKGDESFHWYETPDKYTLLRNEKGIFEYATLNKSKDLVPSGIAAKDVALRTASDKTFLSSTPTNLRYSASQLAIMRQIEEIKITEQERAFPTTGSRKLICILMGFTDLAFTKTQSDFNNLFNQLDYTTDGAVGSVKDFYLENSWNQLTLSVTVAGPYTAANNMAYYGANNGSGYDTNPRVLVTEAVNLANPDVNYADFDNDANGSVDGVYVIYAGYGEEAGASVNAIWAHASSISTVTLDGKTISRYSCSSELRGKTGTGITRIGVICHEFGHVLGAPDYYDTNYNKIGDGDYTGTGSWDLMAGGSWNGASGGACPAHHNGYTKWHYYNWFSPTLLATTQDVTVDNIEDNIDAYYYNTATAGELFFIENRQQTGFDAYIPGHGMIIYHVDQNGIAGAGNQINVTHPQYFYPVCASATTNPSATPSSYGSINSAGCPFPGTSGKTEFTDFSTPHSHDWDGNNTNFPVTNIVETTGVITFDFGDPDLPSNFTATASSVSQIDLSWTLNANNDSVLVAWSATGTFGNPTDGIIYSTGNSIPGGGTVLYKGKATSFNHTSLASGTTYYYKIWSKIVGNSYSSGTPTSETTFCLPVSEFPFSEGFTSGVQPNCWSQIDHQGNNQIWQFGTTTETTSPNLTGNYAYINSDNYGDGGVQNADLISPVLDFKNQTNIILSFNHYYWHYTGSSATLSYSIDNGANWTQLQQWTATSATNPAVFSQDVTAQVAGYSEVLFKWNYTGTYAWYWAIDDISVTAETTVGYNTLVTNVSLGNGQTDCWNALENVTVAGPTYSVVLQSGSEANFIAGESINFKEGFHAQQGSQMHAYITETADYCSSLVAPAVVNTPVEKSGVIAEIVDVDKNKIGNSKQVKIFPNPNNGKFFVELTNFEGISEVSVTNMSGAMVRRLLTTGDKVEIELPMLHRGIYFVTIKNGDNVTSKKFVVQ
jgi:M6 family metalloprotease-like protein